LLPAYFGQFTLNDYDEVIIALLERGDVRCEWRHRLVGDKSQRVPGNEDTLLWR